MATTHIALCAALGRVTATLLYDHIRMTTPDNCPRCEAPIQAGQTVCTRCGLHLSLVALITPVAPTPQPTVLALPPGATLGPAPASRKLPLALAVIAVLVLSVAVVMAQTRRTDPGSGGVVATATPSPIASSTQSNPGSVQATATPSPGLMPPNPTSTNAASISPTPTSPAAPSPTSTNPATPIPTSAPPTFQPQVVYTVVLPPPGTPTNTPTRPPLPPTVTPQPTSIPASAPTNTPLPANTPVPPTFTPPPIPTATHPLPPTWTPRPLVTPTVRVVPSWTPRVVPTWTPRPAPPPTPSLVIGSTAANFASWDVTLTSMDTRSVLTVAEQHVEYRPNGTFWLLRVTARNNATQARSLGATTDFVLRDAGGTLYSELSNHGTMPDIREVAVLEGTSYLNAVAPPGGSITTLLLYDVPTGVQPTQLVGRIIVGPNAVSVVGQVSWDLTKK